MTQQKTQRLNRMKKFKFILFLLLTTAAFAQEFSTKAAVRAVQQDGLHRILITPEIRSLSSPDQRDVRLYDSKGTEVPYLINTIDTQKNSSHFDAFPIVSRNSVPAKSSSIIAENVNSKPLNEIVLAITNSEVTKTYSISGSNDQKQWFGLINNQQLYDLNSNTKTFVYQTIPLPLSTYRYIKVDFNDVKTLPIEVLKIGIFKQETYPITFINVTPTTIKTDQLTDRKQTRIRVHFDNPQAIHQITFDITNPALYNRDASIVFSGERRVKRKMKPYTETLYRFVLNADQSKQFNISELNKKDFDILIDNGDNQPLTINSIGFKQIPVYLIADLKVGEKYTLKTGNNTLQAPQYDLSYFESSIANDLPLATFSKITSLAKPVVSIESYFWQRPWFLWVCIGIGGLVILYFSLSLLKDMKKE